MKKVCKTRHKRWLKAHLKNQHKTQFKESFRDCFVRKGILSNN